MPPLWIAGAGKTSGLVGIKVQLLASTAGVRPSRRLPMLRCRRCCAAASQLAHCFMGATLQSTQAANNVTMIQVRIRIKRFWRYSILNTVIPVRI